MVSNIAPRNAYAIAMDAAREFAIELPSNRDKLEKSDLVTQVKEALGALSRDASSSGKIQRIEGYLLRIERASLQKVKEREWAPALTGLVAAYTRVDDAQVVMREVGALFQRPADETDVVQAYRGREERAVCECIEKWLDDPSVPLAIPCFPTVKNLDDFLPNVFKKTSAGQVTTIIGALVTSCPNLEVLDLKTCANITPGAILLLASLKELKKLEFEGNMKKEHLPALVSLTQLQELRLNRCHELEDSSLEVVAQMSGLKRLTLHHCSKLTNHCFSHLLSMINLISLWFEGVLDLIITDEALQYILQMTWLENLHFTSFRAELTLEAVAGLARMTKLKSLSITSSFAVQHVSGMPELKKFYGDSEIRDEDLRYLSECTGLEELNLWNTRVTDEGLKHLAKLVNIKRLNLPSEITDTGLASISHMTKIERFECAYNNKITDEGLQHLAFMKELKRVTFRGCHGLTGTGFRHLEEMVKMEELDLQSCRGLQDIAFSYMRNMKLMKKLQLCGSPNLTVAAFQNLSAMANMEVFGANNTGFSLTDLPALAHMTKLKQLTVCSFAATIDGMQHLKMFGQLVDLAVGVKAGNKDEALAHVAELQNLRRLDLHIGEWNCEEDATASATLKRAIPRLLFEHFY